MRSTIVPAQVTTVEDRIAGGLGVAQLMLLAVPMFGGIGLFMALPPFSGYAVYKLVLVICLAVLCGGLAVRIKGKILLSWMLLISHYNLRPRYYVFDKNDDFLRGIEAIAEENAAKDEKVTQYEPVETQPQLTVADLVRAESIIKNPQANLHFKTDRKGRLNVYITEVQ